MPFLKRDFDKYVREGSRISSNHLRNNFSKVPFKNHFRMYKQLYITMTVGPATADYDGTEHLFILYFAEHCG